MKKLLYDILLDLFVSNIFRTLFSGSSVRHLFVSLSKNPIPHDLLQSVFVFSCDVSSGVSSGLKVNILRFPMKLESGE